MKSRKDREYISGRESAGKVSETWRGSSRLANGGSDSAISHAVAPTDHISILRASYEPLKWLSEYAIKFYHGKSLTTGFLELASKSLQQFPNE